MADDIGVIGKGSVQVVADMSGYDAAMSKVPDKFAQAERKIRAQMVRNILDMKSVGATGLTASGRDYDVVMAQQDALTKKLKTLAATATATAGEIAKVAKTAEKIGGRQGGGTGGSGNARANTNRLQQFAYIIDDLQYVPEQGLRPVLNNLAQVSPLVALIGIAIDMVARHWSFFTGAAEKAKTPIQELEAKIKELEARPVKLGMDTSDLDVAKKKLADLKENEEIVVRLRTTRSDEATERGQGVEKAVINSGGLDKIVQDLSMPVLVQMDKDKVIKKWNTAVEVVSQGFIDEITAASKGDEDARRRLMFAAKNSAPGPAQDFGDALKKMDADNFAASIADAQTLLGQYKDADADAVESGDALNLQQFKDAQEKRRKQARGLMGSELTLDLLKRNAPVSEEGRAGAESDLRGRLTKAGFDEGKAEKLAREMVDLTLSEIDKQAKERVASGQAGSEVAARSSLRRVTEGQVRDERQAQIQKEFGKAEMLGTDSYLSKITLAGQSATSDPVRQNVEEGKKLNQKMEKFVGVANEALGLLKVMKQPDHRLRTARYSRKS